MIKEIFNRAVSQFVEVEEKYLIKNETDYYKALFYCLHSLYDSIDKEYSRELNGTGYYDMSVLDGVLESRPVTWYYDTPDRRLAKSKGQIRLRSSKTNDTSFELGIKGFPIKRNGITIRHEEEFFVKEPIVDFSLFQSQKSLDFISQLDSVGIKDTDLVPMFATDVTRLTFMIRLDDIPIEIAFDDIAYVDKNSKCVDRQWEVELEYKGTGQNSATDIKRVFTKIINMIRLSNVDVTLTNRSKSVRGNDILNRCENEN